MKEGDLLTDIEKRAHDLTILIMSHGVNHLSANGQKFSFERWEQIMHGNEDGCDFLTSRYWECYQGILKSLKKNEEKQYLIQN